MDDDYDKIGKQIVSIRKDESEKSIKYTVVFNDGDIREFTESKIYKYADRYPRWFDYAKQNKINITIEEKDENNNTSHT
jgi:hypothetical protein